ncbi:ABC-type sugar transport system, ATPase component [Lactobacillus selangorensis]|uniref:ABC-type sugar transport system, ATPase component n=1 Tax=Lactobacillus selangorensis TaxID=81857 RepID=A0A0R2FP57_9LACO|nr:ABC transporter ATP-binding protein [Lactobacillus selangorensis]KRN27283.1 ABC-type sugar transport system, ATPase component [Lactobacillus selangorensis]KRN29934.1 ABC-type sugar transport system, ATPase component [Lactobacillus selangorensis]
MSIRLTNVSKGFEHTQVLSDISVTIAPGEFFVMVGPSGSGKSTLLRIIAGLTSVTAGQIYFDEREVTALPPKERNLSMVFQNYALLPFMNVAQNVRFGLDNQQLSANEKNKRVDWALDLVHLSGLRDRKPKALSGGQQQRVSLARALAAKTPLVLMDEPLSNLDAQLRAEMRAEIIRLHREIGMTLIYVTHDQVEAMTMGDRILVLDAEQIQQLGTPLELYNHPANEFVAKFIGTPEMNIVPITVNEHNQFSLGTEFAAQQAVPVPFALPAGHYHLGIRPEQLVPLAAAGTAALPATVADVQQLGNDTLIFSDCNGQQLVSRIPQQFEVAVGSRLQLAVPPQKGAWHLFDAQTGAAIKEGVADGGR